MQQKHYFPAIFLLVVLIAFGGCQLIPPSLQNLTVGTEVDDETKEVLDPGDTFPRSTPLLYASVYIKNAPADTPLKAVWKREGREVTEPIDLAASGTRFAAFTLKKPPEGFRSGEYSITVEIENTETLLEKSFTID